MCLWCELNQPYYSFTQHYNDFIMGSMASQITSLTTVYSALYSGADQRKHQSSVSLAFVRGIHRWLTVEFPAQMASNAENFSIWWRHHELQSCLCLLRTWMSRWWRHHVQTLSASLVFYEGNPLVPTVCSEPCGFPPQRSSIRNAKL